MVFRLRGWGSAVGVGGVESDSVAEPDLSASLPFLFETVVV